MSVCFEIRRKEKTGKYVLLCMHNQSNLNKNSRFLKLNEMESAKSRKNP
jgi:hypothetical protein